MGEKKLSRVDHTLPIYSPRTTYNSIRSNDENLLSNLTLNFDPFTINVLKNEFFIRKWQLNLYEFILVVKEHLLAWQMDISNREKKLIRCLVNLFDQIDLNGNKLLEWDEFTNFIIEQATVLNQIKTKQDEIKQYTLSNVRLQHKFQTGMIKISAGIAKSVYISDIDRVAFFEEGTDEIYFMNHVTGALNQKSLKVESKPEKVVISSLKKCGEAAFKIEKKETLIDKKSIILDMIYISDAKYQVLLTSNNVGFVTGWVYKSNGFVLATQPSNEGEFLQHEFKNDVYLMTWDSVNELLYCGQKDGEIKIWNLKNDTETQLDYKDTHKDIVTAMIAMPKLQFLASASMDGTLVLWDTIKNVKKRPAYKEHKRGIVDLAFNESLILLFSAGYDHDIYVWNPYIDSYITKICAHNAPLVGISIIENTPQLVSLDAEGILKIWDVKKFNCVQTFTIELADSKHKFNPQHLSYVSKPLKLLISGRTLVTYDYDKNYNPLSVDDFPAICCKFDPNSLCFVTPHGNKLKIWNCLNGDIKKIFSDVTRAEITSFAFDHLCKRMIVGDSEGNTSILNTCNGALIKRLPKHSAEVTKVLHIFHKISDREKDIINIFVTASSDNTIKISDDNKINESELLKTIVLQDTVTSLSFDPFNKYIVSGFSNGIVGFWEIDTGKANGWYEEYKDDEITSLCPLPELSYLFVSNAQGLISLVALPPFMWKYKRVQKFVNIDKESQKAVGILAMQYNANNERLYLVDDKGMLKCYSAEIIIRDLRPVVITQRSTMQSTSLISQQMQQLKLQTTMPVIREDALVLEWETLCHKDQIKSLEVVADENLIVTTGFDKKVKIWNGRSGAFIESFQQNYERKEAQPIAYKRIGTQEIYNTSFDQRIDAIFQQKLLARQMTMSKQRKEGDDIEGANAAQKQTAQARTEQQTSLNKGQVGQQLVGILKEAKKAHAKESSQSEAQQVTQQQQNQAQAQPQEKEVNLKNLSNYQKSEKEEFDPFYDYSKIDHQFSESMSSNNWKLKINFDQYFRQFEQTIDSTMKEVVNLEKQLQSQESQDLQRSYMLKQKEDELKELDLSKYDKEIGQYAQSDEQLKVNINKQVDNMQLILQRNYGKLEKSQGNDLAQRQQQDMLANQQTNKKVFTVGQGSRLFKQQLKDKLADKNAPELRLSKKECDAANKLAAALCNVDADDYRVLKFQDFKVKKEATFTAQQKAQRSGSGKDYVKQNRDTITKFMQDLEKLKKSKKGGIGGDESGDKHMKENM